MAIFITAEIGINHNGNMDICKELIDVAIDAGCDAVKFQKRDIDDVYTQEFLNSTGKVLGETHSVHKKKALNLMKFNTKKLLIVQKLFTKRFGRWIVKNN